MIEAKGESSQSSDQSELIVTIAQVPTSDSNIWLQVIAMQEL